MSPKTIRDNIVIESFSGVVCAGGMTPARAKRYAQQAVKRGEIGVAIINLTRNTREEIN